MATLSDQRASAVLRMTDAQHESWARNVDVGSPATTMAGVRTPYSGGLRVADRPMPGHFAVRLMSHRRWLDEGRAQYGGYVQPWVPALVYAPCPAVFPDMLDWPYHPEWTFEPLERSAYPLRASIAEKDELDDSWAMRVWNSGRQITAGDYAWLMARRAWARRWAPASYEAQSADLTWLRSLE